MEVDALGEILVATSAAAGLVTLGTFLWHLVRRNANEITRKRLDALQKRFEATYGVDLLHEDIWQGLQKDSKLSHAELDKKEEEVLVEYWMRQLSRGISSRQLTEDRPLLPPTPRNFQFLIQHLPEELRPHKKELLQFLEDGMADLGPKKRKRFLFTQYFSLAIYIGKGRLFKISKTWRRTIR